MWERRWWWASPSPQTPPTAFSMSLPQGCCSSHWPAQPQRSTPPKKRQGKQSQKRQRPQKDEEKTLKSKRSLWAPTLLFVEVGESCSCVIAIQVGLATSVLIGDGFCSWWCLSWTLDFLLIFIDSCKTLSNLSVKNIPQSYCIIPLNFHKPSVWRSWDTHIRHDQKQLSVSEHTTLHKQLPCFAAVVWHLHNGELNISGVTKGPLLWFRAICLLSWRSSSAATKQAVKQQAWEETFQARPWETG